MTGDGLPGATNVRNADKRDLGGHPVVIKKIHTKQRYCATGRMATLFSWTVTIFDKPGGPTPAGALRLAGDDQLLAPHDGAAGQAA